MRTFLLCHRPLKNSKNKMQGRLNKSHICLYTLNFFFERVCGSQYLSLWLTHVRQNCRISAIPSLRNRLMDNSGIRFISFEYNGLQTQRLFFFFLPKIHEILRRDPGNLWFQWKQRNLKFQSGLGWLGFNRNSSFI